MKIDITLTKTAFQALMDMLNRSDRTEREAREKLLKKGFSLEDTEVAIARAKEYRYLSDELYAERYVFFKRGTKGKYLIMRELTESGITDDVATAALERYDDSADVCKEVAFRYMRSKVWEPKTWDKILRFLVYKGFSYDEAKRAATAVKAECAADNGNSAEGEGCGTSLFEE